MKSDLKRRLELLEAGRGCCCPFCEYLKSKLEVLSDGQLRVLYAITTTGERGPAPEISESEKRELVDFFKNMPAHDPTCPRCGGG